VLNKRIPRLHNDPLTVHPHLPELLPMSPILPQLLQVSLGALSCENIRLGEKRVYIKNII
jgi:hypothetical protein